MMQSEPRLPFAVQHQAQPGLESKLRPAPRWHAPHYHAAAKLEDKVALITGGDSGIGRAVAFLYAREGADVAIVYLSSHEDAEETRRVPNELLAWKSLPGAADHALPLWRVDVRVRFLADGERLLWEQVEKAVTRDSRELK